MPTAPSRAIVHIGAHKTGTTYLQRVFYALRPVLRDAGVAFPSEWIQSEDQPSHRRLYAALTDDRADTLRAELLAQAAELLLISSEDLVYLQEPQIQALRGFLDDAAVTIVFHCRRWSEIMPSVWQERIKHGFSETFLQFVAAALADPNRLEFLQFGAVLDRYAAVFGKTALRIVCYNSVSDLARHFLDTFLPAQAALLENAALLLEERPNRSLPPVQTEIVRVLNLIHRSQDGAQGSAVREWFLRDGQRYDLTRLSGTIQAHLTTLRLNDAEPALDAIHRRLWAEYGDCVVDPHPADRFFAPVSRDIPYAEPRYLADPAIRDQYDALYRAFRTS